MAISTSSKGITRFFLQSMKRYWSWSDLWIPMLLWYRKFAKNYVGRKSSQFLKCWTFTSNQADCCWLSTPASFRSIDAAPNSSSCCHHYTVECSLQSRRSHNPGYPEMRWLTIDLQGAVVQHAVNQTRITRGDNPSLLMHGALLHALHNTRDQQLYVSSERCPYLSQVLFLVTTLWNVVVSCMKR